MRLVVVAALLLLLLAGIAIGTYIGVRAATHKGATVSATNGKIAFGQVFPNYGVTINTDGSDRHKIGPGSTTCNTWSPDSSKVLCNRWSKEGVQPATANRMGPASRY